MLTRCLKSGTYGSMKLQMLQYQYADTRAAYDQIRQHPEVWDTIKLRTDHPQSPHRETSDCWLRYNPIKNFKGDGRAFNEEHIAEWYPYSDTLTECRALAERIYEDYSADRMGFVLLTKIPPRKNVYPHTDSTWHARFYEKFCLSIQANRRQKFYFEDESLASESGDLFWFDNGYTHWVTNNSDEDRISLIVCIHRSH